MLGLQHAVGLGGANARSEVRLVQQLLNRHRGGLAPMLKVDGIVGPRTLAAIRDFQRNVVRLHNVDSRVDPAGPTLAALNRAPHERQAKLRPPSRPASPPPVAERRSEPPRQAASPQSGVRPIAWGAKVSSGFKRKVLDIAGRLEISPDFLMSCMAFETGETFSPSVRNAAGSGAVGLIQFMPPTARELRTSPAALAAMSAEQQLDYVERYFRPYRGRIRTIEDIYMAILKPKAIGRDAEYVLFSGSTKAYKQNKGLDKDRDGAVNKFEAAAAVRAKYQKGLKPGFIG